MPDAQTYRPYVFGFLPICSVKILAHAIGVTPEAILARFKSGHFPPKALLRLGVRSLRWMSKCSLPHYAARQENEAILLQPGGKVQGEGHEWRPADIYSRRTEEARGAQNLVREDERLHLRGLLAPSPEEPIRTLWAFFRPKRDYTKVLLPVTYILCDECVKLPRTRTTAAWRSGSWTTGT